jgi:class 3 adenylate cyclase/tetratricopeptide (TPR) repeat protein
VERKIATVLFVDLVDSTGLFSDDPEVVRRRVTLYFERARECIERHGGTVEKFAGDAVMAAFGVPRAHEDDADRAVRAAFAVMESVHELGLEAHAGIESGEVVVDEADSTFATGEAVNLAARLQQAAEAGEIVLGPGVRRLTAGTVEVEDVGPLDVKGRPQPLWSWRAIRVLDGQRRTVGTRFVGREDELELLQNTYTRAARERRAHLVTVYGEPGVGKSRLVREFLAGVERATALTGRALPYGEGVTYWPLASMIKASAGIDDDDPAGEAFEKLRLCCESEAVADLLAAALGVLGAAEGKRTSDEIAWAAVNWARQLADAQPLVLVFEDMHWADDRLLQLVEHLARTLKDAPTLILAVARHDLAEEHPAWGGGNPRAAALDLGPLDDDESIELANLLLDGHGLPPAQCALVLEKAEGNPLFLEETARMIVDSEGGPPDRIPDTVQALVAARIDRLPDDEKRLLQHAAVMGRVFWRGALDRLSSNDTGTLLDRLLERDLVVPEERSTIGGHRAFRFRHVLIREVAYATTTKAQRAHDHRAYAEWLGEHAPDELVEIRAYHFDHAAALVAELDSHVPADLAATAAAALDTAVERAIARESYASARRLAVRAVELEPTLARRCRAGHAAWRLGDFDAVMNELPDVAEAGDPLLRGRALVAIADVMLHRTTDAPAVRTLIEEALDLLQDDSDVDFRFDALRVARDVAWWVGELDEVVELERNALDLATKGGRVDLQITAIQGLGTVAMSRLDLSEAEALLRRAEALAAEDANARSRLAVLRLRAWLDSIRGDHEAALAGYRDQLEIVSDLGQAQGIGHAKSHLGKEELDVGHVDTAERLLRDAIRTFKALGDRGYLCEAQRSLAQALVAQGRVDEAEKVALEARRIVGAEDRYSRATTVLALGVVRAAQGRDEEAETLLRNALDSHTASGFRFGELEALEVLADFLRARGRDDEAADLDRRRAGLLGETYAPSTDLIA